MFLKLKAIIFFFKIQIYYLKNLNIFFFLYFTIKKNSSPPRSLKLVTSRLSTQPSFRALEINSMSEMYSNNKLLHKHYCKVSFFMIPFICTLVCIIVWRFGAPLIYKCLHFPVFVLTRYM